MSCTEPRPAGWSTSPPSTRYPYKEEEDNTQEKVNGRRCCLGDGMKEKNEYNNGHLMEWTL